MKVKSESEVAQSCPTLSGPMDYSLAGSSVHGIFQARVLEWGAIDHSIIINNFWERKITTGGEERNYNIKRKLQTQVLGLVLMGQCNLNALFLPKDYD